MSTLRLSRLIATLLAGFLTLTSSYATEAVQWSDTFPALPDKYGYAGGYAAIVGQGDDRTLIFAGGANFPYENPFDVAKNEAGEQPKVFHSSAYSIQLGKTGLEPKGEWKNATPLPEALAYGASVSLPHDGSALFIGGNAGTDGSRKSSQVYRLTLDNGTLTYSSVAELPVGVTNIAATLVGKTVYLFSGISEDGAVQQFLSLDTSHSDPATWTWKSLAWPEREAGVPARARGNYTIGTISGKVYLFAGRDGHDSTDSSMRESDIWKVNDNTTLDFFRDCYAYTPGIKDQPGNWQRIADLPYGISAAPSSAVPSGYSHLLVLGGAHVDFQLSLRDRQKHPTLDANYHGFDHPGFPRNIWGYHHITNTWAEFGKVPDQQRSTVTAPVVIDGSQFLVLSGEWSPKLRSSAVRSGTIKANRSPFGLINWVVVTVYLMGMVGIGYWFMKREAASSTDDYFRGGQRIPWWVAGLSIFATILSSITFMAIPAVAYSDDWNRWIGQWPILILVPLVVFFYLPFFRKLNLTSAYEYLEARFNLAIRLIASASFMIFHIGRIAIVLYLPALALSSVTDINIYIAIVVIGLLCVIYTVMGGIEAVVWTDAIQALVLIGGALLCFGLVVAKVDGGFSAITQTVGEGKFLTAEWSLDAAMDFSSGTKSGWLFFLGFMFAALPSYTSGQDVVQRYVTTPTEKEAAQSLWLNIFMTLVGSAIFFGLGTALYVFYQNHPAMLDPTMKSNDGILPFYIMQNLPVGVAGLIIAGVFAAAQSTISSSLNSVATAFVTDYYGRVIAPESSDHKRLNVARNIVVVLGITGIGCACYVSAANMKSAFDTFNMFVGFVMGPLAAIFALGIFTKRVSGSAALIAAAAGAIALGAVQITNNAEITNIWGLFNGLICFIVTFSVGLIAGLVLPANPEQVKGLNIHSK